MSQLEISWRGFGEETLPPQFKQEVIDRILALTDGPSLTAYVERSRCDSRYVQLVQVQDRYYLVVVERTFTCIIKESDLNDDVRRRIVENGRLVRLSSG